MYSLLAVVPCTASEQGELGVGCRSQEVEQIVVKEEVDPIPEEVKNEMEMVNDFKTEPEVCASCILLRVHYNVIFGIE
ncbi:hypothetical protein C0J52_07213 [Blattella germanica]|nr:hypothetical protein C0J52_07213 [Blattella germanica]